MLTLPILNVYLHDVPYFFDTCRIILKLASCQKTTLPKAESVGLRAINVFLNLIHDTLPYMGLHLSEKASH